MNLILISFMAMANPQLTDNDLAILDMASVKGWSPHSGGEADRYQYLLGRNPACNTPTVTTPTLATTK